MASGKSPGGGTSGKKVAPNTYDQDGQIIFGPTTRKAWKEFVEATSTPTNASGQSSGNNSAENKSKNKAKVRSASSDAKKKVSKSPVAKKKVTTSTVAKKKPKKDARESDADEEEEEDEDEDNESSSGASSSDDSSSSGESSNDSNSSSESEEEEEESENVDENIVKKSSKTGLRKLSESGSKAVKSSGAMDKKSPSSDVDSSKKPGRGRPRKYAPGVSAVVKRAASTAVGKKISSSSSSKNRIDTSTLPVRPRGRPPKSPRKNVDRDGDNSLDVFHQQTLKTISSTLGLRTSPAPGTFEDRIDTSLNSPSYLSHLPSAIIKDSSLLSMEQILEQLLGQQKRQLSNFIAYMQTPEYRIQLSKEIEEEKKRNQLLKLQVSAVENSIKSLQASGVESLLKKLHDVGIDNVSTPQDVLLKAGEIINRNKLLLEQELTLTAQVKQQEMLNQQLESLRAQIEAQNSSSSAGGGKKGSKGSKAGDKAQTSARGKGAKRQSTSSNSSAASSASFDTKDHGPATFGTQQSSLANLDKVSSGFPFGAWNRPSGTPSPVTFSSLSSSCANSTAIKSTAGSSFATFAGQASPSKNQSKLLITSSGTTITPTTIPVTSGSSTSGSSTSSISNAKDQINSIIMAQLSGGPATGPHSSVPGSSNVPLPPDSMAHGPPPPPLPVPTIKGKGAAKEPKVKKEPKKRGPKPKDSKTHLVPKEKLHELLSQQPLVKPDSPKVPMLSRTRKASAASSAEPVINYGIASLPGHPTPGGHGAIGHGTESKVVENKNISKVLKDEKHNSSPRNESSPRAPSSTGVKHSPHFGADSDNGTGGEVKERLTLTLVLDRKNDSASVKSLSKSASNNTSPEKSPVKSPEYNIGSVGSTGQGDEREPGSLRSGTKRKGVICSPERSTTSKKTRSKSALVIDESSQSPASTTSSGGEKKITIKFGSSTSRTESSLITTDPSLATGSTSSSVANCPGGGQGINGPSTATGGYNATNPVNVQIPAMSMHHSATNPPPPITTKSSGSYRKWKKEMDNSFDKSNLANVTMNHLSNDSQSSNNSTSQFGTNVVGSGPGHPALPTTGINNSDGHSTTSSTRPNSGSSIESLMSMDSNSAVTDPLDSVTSANNRESVVNKYQPPNYNRINPDIVDEMRRQQQYQPNRHQQPPPPTMYGTSTEDVYQQFLNSAAARNSGARDSRTGLPHPYMFPPGMWPPTSGAPPGSAGSPFIRGVPMFPWKGH